MHIVFWGLVISVIAILALRLLKQSFALKEAQLKEKTLDAIPYRNLMTTLSYDCQKLIEDLRLGISVAAVRIRLRELRRKTDELQAEISMDARLPNNKREEALQGLRSLHGVLDAAENTIGQSNTS